MVLQRLQRIINSVGAKESKEQLHEILVTINKLVNPTKQNLEKWTGNDRNVVHEIQESQFVIVELYYHDSDDFKNVSVDLN